MELTKPVNQKDRNITYVSWTPNGCLEIIQPGRQVLREGFTISWDGKTYLLALGALYVLSDADTGEDGYQFHARKLLKTSKTDIGQAIIDYDAGVAAALEIAQLEFYDVEEFLNGTRNVLLDGHEITAEELIACYDQDDALETFCEIIRKKPEIMEGFFYDVSKQRLFKPVDVFRTEKDGLVLIDKVMTFVGSHYDWNDKVEAVAHYYCHPADFIDQQQGEEEPDSYVVPKAFLQMLEEE